MNATPSPSDAARVLRASPTCAVICTTDEAYLFPTLVAAIQARKHASPDAADILICHFGLTSHTEAIFGPICADSGIGLLFVAPATIEQASPMMSRLFLDRFIPARYTQFLYMDGDIQISRSLDPLIAAVVDPGCFLAVNDPMTFLLGDPGPLSRDLGAHLAGIGLTPGEAGRYFNTGVLRINRQGWNAIGERAWALTRGGARTYRFPDQDPLNIAGRAVHRPLSLAWNFPVFMRNAGLHTDIDPCVTHYMSSPKPWHGAFRPWTRQACRPYASMIARYPDLAPYRQRLTLRWQLHYRLLQTYKHYHEAWSWGRDGRRSRVLAYEAGSMLSGVR